MYPFLWCFSIDIVSALDFMFVFRPFLFIYVFFLSVFLCFFFFWFFSFSFQFLLRGVHLEWSWRSCIRHWRGDQGLESSIGGDGYVTWHKTRIKETEELLSESMRPCFCRRTALTFDWLKVGLAVEETYMSYKDLIPALLVDWFSARLLHTQKETLG